MIDRIAEIAVSAATYAIDKAYDYLVPERLVESVLPGVRVTIPFGRGNRRCEGIVISVRDETPEIQLKAVEAVRDAEPVLSDEQLRLAAWMHERCFCTLYDAAKAMLPTGLWYRQVCIVSLKKNVDKENAYELCRHSARDTAALDALYANGGKLELGSLKTALGDKTDAAPVLQRLKERGIVSEEYREFKNVSDKTQAIATLVISSEEARELAEQKRRRAPQQAELLRVLADFQTVSVKELCYFTGAGTGSVSALERAGYVSIHQEEVFRRPDIDFSHEAEPIVLNSAQQHAFEGLKQLCGCGEARAALLYGVTGSGKTAVYIELIKHVLGTGKKALVLVPEIALTPQLTELFAAHFGRRIAVMHSSLKAGERYDEWKRIRAGEVDVVVGTRSAVFAPLDKLGLIVMDEEQEDTYKSENTPRYHARDVAKFRAVRHGGLLLMCSATPSVESFYHAETGRYELFELPARYNENPLPRVIITDMRAERRNMNPTGISARLAEEMRRNLEKGEQTILLINRRGSSRLVSCVDCGHIVECPNCSVAMTYHSANRRLMCHYCGRSEPVPQTCPECGGSFSYTGAGTQKIELELRKLFPETEILRMDTDTVSPRMTHEMMFSRFRDEKIPILVGTQMVAKGLNFENVTLVGVLSADQSLYAEDYRAAEGTFSLIAQVIGRAGRGDKEGRAVIQTFSPENDVIQKAALQDYPRFYSGEICLRSARHCPPFDDIYVISVSGIMEAEVLQSCARVVNSLRNYFASDDEVRILGPAPAPVAKVNNRYRYRITVRGRDNAEMRRNISHLLRSFAQDKANRGVSIFADKNPND